MDRWFQYFPEYALAVFVRGGGRATTAVTFVLGFLGIAGPVVIFFVFDLDFESVLLSFLGFLGILSVIYGGGFVAYRDEHRRRVALESGPALMLEYGEGPEFHQIDRHDRGELHTFRVRVHVGNSKRSVDDVHVQVKEIEPAGILRGCPHDLHRMNDNVAPKDFEKSRTVNPDAGILFDVLSYYLDYAEGVESLEVTHISRKIDREIPADGSYCLTISATGKDANSASLCLDVEGDETITVSERSGSRSSSNIAK